ncbi:MAG TPA: DUF5916 domain-containing protein, partial [Vicinamibacterales bacterium]|nr:DUF5916 domain-containing protein [Vicinamibacterales bacterium]
RWAGASNDYEIFQTSQAGVLTELPRFDVGLGLSIRPAITAGAKKLVGVARDRIHDVSLDVTQKLGANLLSSLTVNTDFAETEVDVRQTNLTRFEILFPEKRAFFLEGADIFDFGMGMNGVLIPFFSRRVGLTDAGVPVPINAGGKVNGRVGDTSVAALVAGTRPVAGLVGSDATMGAARIKQNIFSESSVGMIATFGDQLGRPGSWMTGGDYTYQTSKFHGDKNLLVGAWGLINRRNDVAGDKTAYGFGVMYPNDRWKFNLTSARIGNGFDPSLGFVPRNGVDVWQASAGFDPRPGKAGIRQMLNGTDLLLVNDLTNRWESYTWKIRPLDWLLESGDRFGAAYSRVGDRPPANFAIFQSDAAAVFIPAGSSEWERHSVTGASAPKRPISASVTWESGGFYGGTLDSVELALAVRRSLFKVELGAERHAGSAAGWTAVNEDTDVKIRGGRFIQRLYNCRAEIKFSPDLQLASFVQYDNESALLGTNTRLRWTFHSFGDLFVVYNHNLKRAVNALNRQIFEFDSNVLMVKLQYAWRP